MEERSIGGREAVRNEKAREKIMIAKKKTKKNFLRCPTVSSF